MMSKDIPIIFSPPMVRALLDGRKTMTRRLAHMKPRIAIQVGDGPIEPIIVESNWQKVKAGDRLWVREAAAFIWPDDVQPARKEDCIPEYRADTDGRCRPGNWPDEEKGNPDCPKWCPSIHMPRWTSRLTLIVTGIKIERLQDISNDDAKAEGIAWCDKFEWWHCDPNRNGAGPGHGSSPAKAFLGLWLMLHGEKSLAENPFVAAITFRVIKVNIDTPEARIAA